MKKGNYNMNCRHIEVIFAITDTDSDKQDLAGYAMHLNCSRGLVIPSDVFALEAWSYP